MKQAEGKTVRYHSGRGILLFSLILLIGLIIALIAVLPQFYINRIEIEGERHLTETELISASGIESGKHLLLYVSGDIGDILQLRYGKVEKRLLAAYPYLESVEVRAKFPYKVSIQVKERTEVGYLETDKDYAVIDSQGMVLERLPLNAELNAPVFRGISAAGLEAGDYIADDSRRAVLRTLLVVNAVLRADQTASDQMSLIHHIKAYYPYSANTLYMEMINLDGQTLHVRLNPSDNPEARVSWLRNALLQGAFEDLGPGVLDLAGKQNVFSPSQTVPAVPTFTAAPAESTRPPEMTAAETTAAAAGTGDRQPTETAAETAPLNSSAETAAAESAADTAAADGGAAESAADTAADEG